MRVLIADDEPLARRALAQLLAAHADVEIAAECADGAEVRDTLAVSDADVLLLDIRMPELSGIETARLLASDRPLVVFVTAHEEFGARAFEHGAVEYLLKPVTQSRVDLALNRVRARLAADEDAARYRALAAAAPAQPRFIDRLVARVGDRDIIIPVDRVDLISADDVYSAVHAGGRRYLLRTSLDELERSLPPDRFVRIHRSHLVAVHAVVAVHRGGLQFALELRNGARVPVSRRRRRKLHRIVARVEASSTTIHDTNATARDTPAPAR